MGNPYISGYTWSSDGIASADAFQPTLSGFTNAFIAQFSSAGTLLWGSYFGGTKYDLASSIVLDGHGNFYVSGNSSSIAGIATSGSYQSSMAGHNDAFLAKFNGSTSGIKSSAANEHNARLFSNPSNGRFVVDVPAGGSVDVLSAEGKRVAGYSVKKGTNELTLPDGIADGMYLINYRGDNGVTDNFKLVLHR
jgi:hypothetical protein